MTIKVIATSKKPGSNTNKAVCPFMIDDNNVTFRQPKR